LDPLHVVVIAGSTTSCRNNGVGFSLSFEKITFQCPELFLAEFLKILGNGHAYVLDNFLIKIEKRQVQCLGYFFPPGTLSTAHKSNQKNRFCHTICSDMF